MASSGLAALQSLSLRFRSSRGSAVSRFLNFVFGESSALIVNAILLAVLLRMLSSEAYGYFAFTQSLNLWLVPLLQLAFGLTAPRLFSLQSDNQLVIRRLLKLRLATALLVALGVAAMSFVTRDRTLAACLLASIPFYFLTASQLDFVCISLGQATIYSRARILSAFLYLSLTVIALLLHAPIWVLPIMNAFGLLVALLYSYAKLRGIPDWQGPGVSVSLPRELHLGPLLSLVVPTTLAQFVQISYYSADIFLLRWFRPSEMAAIGQYSAISRMTQLAAIPIVALLLALGPQIARAFAVGDRRKGEELSGFFRWGSLGFGVAGALLLFSVAPWILSLLSRRPMAVASQVSIWFAISYFLIGCHSPFSAILPYLGAARDYLWVNCVALLVATVGCIVLIPMFGFRGAAASSVIGVASIWPVAKFCYGRRLRRDLRDDPRQPLPLL